VNITLHH